MLLNIELELVLIELMQVFLYPQLGTDRFSRDQRLASLAQRRRFSVLVAGTAALIVHATALLLFPANYAGDS